MDPDEPDFIFNLGQAAARSRRYKRSCRRVREIFDDRAEDRYRSTRRILGLIQFLRYLGRQGSLHVPSGDHRSTVPFEATDNRPILEVRVNGSKQPLRFVLDTGSGMSVISDETAKRLGIKSVAKGGLARAVEWRRKFEIVYGFLNSIEIGAAKVENVPVYIRKFFDRSHSGRRLSRAFSGVEVSDVDRLWHETHVSVAAEPDR